MKVRIELEVPDNFEPLTVGCEDWCPFGFYDDIIGDNACEYYDSCPMKNAEQLKTPDDSTDCAWR